MIDETMWGRVAQCHVDAEDTECFLVGRIVWSNAQWVLMQLLAPHGRWDGIALLAQADYQAVEVDTPYCQKLVKVAALRGEDAQAYPAMGDDPRGKMLNHAQAHQLTAALEICGSGVDDVVGTVEDVSGGLVRVRQWTDDGDADGESAVAVDAVTAIFVGSEQLTYLDLLRRV